MSQSDFSLIPHAVEDRIVQQRVRDGYVNATALCKAAGKLFGNYRQNQTTEEFLEALSLDIGIPISKLIQVFRGRPAKLQGTWVHPQVAVHLAQWLSPQFAVQVSRWVLEWSEQRATDRATVLQTYLSPEMREWEKTFPDELWEEFARLDGWHGPLHKRPKWWGHLVNTLIYDYLDPDVAAHLRSSKPPPRQGQNYHQWLNEDYGLPRLLNHIQQVIGIAKTCQTIRELQEKASRAFGDQRSLALQIDRDPRMLWDGGSVH